MFFLIKTRVFKQMHSFLRRQYAGWQKAGNDGEQAKVKTQS